jgi:hypothetical protein
MIRLSSVLLLLLAPLAVAQEKSSMQQLLDEVRDVVRQWPTFAAQANVVEQDLLRIQRTHRLAFPSA